jgi:hypothetical protein
MRDPQMGNPGPHDPELVDVLLNAFKEFGYPKAYVDTDLMNYIIDSINEVLEEEFDQAWRYRELNK